MSLTLTKDIFNKANKIFTDDTLKKLPRCDLLLNQTYSYETNKYESSLTLQVTVNKAAELAGLCSNLNSMISPGCGEIASGFQLQGTVAAQAQKNSKYLGNVARLDASHMRALPSIRYFPFKLFTGLNAAAYDVRRQKDLDALMSALNNKLFDIVVLNQPPVEVTEEGKTYRIFSGSSDMKNFAGAGCDYIYAADNENPIYNYLDQGHAIIQTRTKGHTYLMVVNQISYEMLPIIYAFWHHPKIVQKFLTNNIFLDANNARMVVLQVERELPAVFKERVYGYLKEQTTEDFQGDENNALISKLIKNEINELVLNDIKISKTKAEYETVSIEATDLFNVVLTMLDMSQPFDIFTIVNLYVTHMVTQLNETKLVQGGRGFVENVGKTVRVNGFDITARVCTDNTRRSVNEHLINKEELVPVLRRATCSTTLEEYNKFVESVAYQSLEVHDALSNGVPVAILGPKNGQKVLLDDSSPKFEFIRKDKSYYLVLDREKEDFVKLKRFVTFLHAVKKTNKQTDDGYYYDANGGYARRNTEWCVNKLKELISSHLDAKGDADKAKTFTDDIFKKYVDLIKKNQKDAEEKSKKLLAQVIQDIDGEIIPDYKGKGRAYKVKGKLRTYVVVDNTNEVFNFETGGYVCIVSKGHQIGVGKDATVARLLALKNDSKMVGQIGTLRAG